MKNKNWVTNILVALLSVAYLNSYSQGDSTALDLTELNLEQLLDIKIVTASKTLMSAGQAPASVHVVTEEQIRVRGYRSLLDLLMDVPDIKVDDKVYSISRNRITVRGVEGQEKIIIMLDGMRISSPTNESRAIMENYPVHLAKQVEIIYGPASALYGADAFSGIINIISRKAEFTSTVSEASYAMGDHGMYNGTLFASTRLNKDITLTLSGQVFYDKGVDFSKEFEEDPLWDMSSHTTGTFNTIFGPITPNAPVKPEYEAPMSAYNIYVGLKAGDFDFSFFKDYAQTPSNYENNPQNAVYNKEVFYGTGVSSVSAKNTTEIGKASFTTTLTGSQFKLNPESNYRNLYSGMEPAYKYAQSTQIKGEEQVELKLSEKTNIIAGGVYENFQSHPESADLQSPVSDSKSIEGILLNSAGFYNPDGIEAKFYAIKYYNVGAYLQLQQRIQNKATITLGARYDYNSRFGSTVNPRLGFVWNPFNKTTLKVMGGTAFLAPTPGSAYVYYGTFYSLDSGRTYQSFFFHLPNPDLKPMLSKNAEVSLHQYLTKNFSVTLTGYYTRVSNLLNFGSDADNDNLYNGQFLGWDVDYIEVFINEGKEEALGGSLKLAYNHNFRNGWLRAYANISYVDGQETDFDTGSMESVELDNISPWMVKGGVDLSIGNFSMSPRLVVMGRQRLEGMDSSDDKKRQTLDGYSLLNISMAYNFGKIFIFGNLTNALNQKYRVTGPNMDLENPSTELFYGNYQDPIRFNGGIRVSF